MGETTTGQPSEDADRLFCLGCERWFTFRRGPELVTCPTCGDGYDPAGGSRMKVLKPKE